MNTYTNAMALGCLLISWQIFSGCDCHNDEPTDLSPKELADRVLDDILSLPSPSVDSVLAGLELPSREDVSLGTPFEIHPVPLDTAITRSQSGGITKPGADHINMYPVSFNDTPALAIMIEASRSRNIAMGYGYRSHLEHILHTVDTIQSRHRSARATRRIIFIPSENLHFIEVQQGSNSYITPVYDGMGFDLSSDSLYSPAPLLAEIRNSSESRMRSMDSLIPKRK